MSYSVCLPNYSVGEDCYKDIPSIVSEFGKKVVVIGGETALSKAKDKIKEAIKDSDLEILDWICYGKEASYENGNKLIENPVVQKADVIFGVGGGRALDTCKYAATQLDKPLFNFPTVASNCAAVTAISVMYNPDGSLNSYYYPKLAQHTFIDTQILSDSPYELLWAGIGDALSKECEALFSSQNKQLSHTPLMGIALSQACTKPLLEYGKEALDSIQKHEASFALEQCALTIIVTCGIVSNLTTQLPDYYYNSSMAHCVYYGSTITKNGHNHLHGEVVSLGVLCLLQMAEDKEQLLKIMEFNNSIGLPVCFEDIEIEEEEFKNMADYVERTCTEWKFKDPSITKEDFLQAMKDQNRMGNLFKEEKGLSNRQGRFI